MKNIVLFILLLFQPLLCNGELGFLKNEIKNRIDKKEVLFVVSNETNIVSVVNDAGDDVAALTMIELFCGDIERVTGNRPNQLTGLNKIHSDAIIAGTLGSSIIKELHNTGIIDTSLIAGKWETYLIKNISINNGHNSAIVVVGSNSRALGYALFSLSEKMGVSPWYFWADVKPEMKRKLAIKVDDYISQSPSVMYRGIFLNDEDWGLQPWAANTFDTETGDIGSKTYAKIFELLLRLKANMIWPAMHKCTRAFFSYPDNVKMAEKYGIVIGSSHCEQMLCNNVDEWKEEGMGHFNYFGNSENIKHYWAKRVDQAKHINGIYTLGMRGIHDSGMQGAISMDEKVAMVEKVIIDQRHILEDGLPKTVSEIPQVFIPYKEVLDVYNNGLVLPEDVTIMWSDDNYGYIRRLNDLEEKKRLGGSGVYYHASYWGRPHDYLWLSSTNPWLIWEEMHKAYKYNAKKMWVLNVGDIKPLEYNISLFMDMAWDMSRFQNGGDVKLHIQNWYCKIFGIHYGQRIADIKKVYFQLAFERRPEFMGWGQTEKTTPNYHTQYKMYSNGDEIGQRIDAYSLLEEQVENLCNEIRTEAHLYDAFYELVYYPIICASNMNIKWLYRHKADVYAREGRLSTSEMRQKSLDAYERIQKETKFYNEELVGGKWRYMMSSNPRELPVFDKPEFEEKSILSTLKWGVAVDGFGSDSITHLPIFYPENKQGHFIDVFLKSDDVISWSMSAPEWVTLTVKQGTLANEENLRQQRIGVAVDWSLIARADKKEGDLKLKVGNDLLLIKVNVDNNFFNAIIDANGRLILPGDKYCEKSEKGWSLLTGLGHSGNSMVYYPEGVENYLNYSFKLINEGDISILLNAIPTHAPNDEGMKLKVLLDGEELGEVNFATTGRSENWKNNVLSNCAKGQLYAKGIASGNHKLTLQGVSPAVIIDYIVIETEQSIKPGYGYPLNL